MRLTIAGNPRAYLAPFSAGTAYLVEAGGETFVVDCGHGTLHTIAQAASGKRIPSIVILSHFHFDHVADFPPLAKLLPKGTPTFAPSGSRANLDALAQAYSFDGPFDLPGPLHEISEPRTVLFGGTKLRFARTRHSAPSIAVSIEADGTRLVLAGDTAPCSELSEIASGADVLVCHTLLPDVDEGADHAKVHMTAAAAGRLARDAGVGRLLLSHLDYRTDPNTAVAAATVAFPRVEVASPLTSYEVEDFGTRFAT